MIPAVLWFVLVTNIYERSQENAKDDDYDIKWHVMSIVILGLGFMVFVLPSFLGVYTMSDVWEDKFDDPGRDDESDYEGVDA